MNTIKTVLEGLLEKVNNLEISEQEEAASLEKVRSIAKSNTTAFREAIHQFDPMSDNELLLMVFEALCEDYINWKTFLLEESKRLVQIALSSEDPHYVTLPIWEISMVDDMTTTDLKDYFQLFSEHFYHSSPVVRHTMINMTDDFIDYLEDIPMNTDIFDRLQEKLQDNNWKVRVLTYHILRLNNRLSKTYKLSFMDTLRSKIGSYRTF